MAVHKGEIGHQQPLISHKKNYCIYRNLLGGLASPCRLVKSLPIRPHRATILVGYIPIISPQLGRTSIKISSYHHIPINSYIPCLLPTITQHILTQQVVTMTSPADPRCFSEALFLTFAAETKTRFLGTCTCKVEPSAIWSTDSTANLRSVGYGAILGPFWGHFGAILWPLFTMVKDWLRYLVKV